MKKLSFHVHPKDATAKTLKMLPTPRLREVLERRFGLKRGPETLEAIGRSWGVTRERVRQVEADALKRLAKPEIAAMLAPAHQALEDHFAHHGHVFEESKLLQSAVEPRFANHIYFLLTVGEPFTRKPEEDLWHHRWFTKAEALDSAQTILIKTAEELRQKKTPVDARALFDLLKSKAREVLGNVPHPDALESYLAITKHIRQNPYGEFGLVSWPTVNPRGVRDKAYAALVKAGKPMHFREVAQAISRVGWSSRKAHPQTVHNELIKDKRFVLVGRGLYALSEWGYQPGTVSQVISRILASSKKPLPKEDVLKRVAEERFVKENTILLNLQNKKLFKRTADGYALV